ncbi:hypothetical protein JOD03_002567 [Chryseomicrobium aureum]|uniref:SIR2 family protein n=1 Tax=Chryseomicrobium aureum TaxID=1441723 RepID=UPI0019583EDE|nr:SIR2 family protein [Chryseomicrobium aureum]MBM7707620.1 hypothetical protein [Chryseomicrobium aureum]
MKPLLNKADALSFLFIGSGFSRRYLNIPTWEDLLRHIATITYDDKYGFIRAENEASKKYNKDSNYNKYMTYLCDIISDDLDKTWYTSDKFKDNRNKYEDLILHQHVPPIKIEISEYINSFSEYLPGIEQELESLNKLSTHSISGLITTNYDNLLERIFGYETYTSQEEILFHSKYDVGEIYKIHGSSTFPESILISTADYLKIEEKHKYISAKLLTIFLEHPIFFIGYSIGDEDIRSILNDIQICLNTEQLKEIANRLFYVVWDPDEEFYRESKYTITFDSGKSLTIRQIVLGNYSFLYDELAQNKSKYPIKMLRHVKEDMYNLLLTNDPDQRMMLSLPSDNMTAEELKKIEFVYGFGMMERAKNGYRIVSTDEIYEDIIFDNGNFHNDLLVAETLPYALSKSGGFLPTRKYTSQFNFDELPEAVKNNCLRFNSIQKILSHSLWLKKSRLSHDKTFEEALNGNEKNINLALVNYTKNSIEDLGGYLKTALKEKNYKTNTDLRRLIRIYDFVKYS